MNGLLGWAWSVLTDALHPAMIGVTESFTETGYLNMKNLIGLIDAICDVYDDPTMTPVGATTFCNLAAQHIARALGCTELQDMDADQMIEWMSSHPDSWQPVPMQDVQELTNEGTLIFAGATSSDLGQAHGHICTVRPGNQILSGKWGLVPRVMNIGAENFIGRAKRGPLQGLPAGVNEAFQPLPKFFAWKPSLGD